MAANQGMLSVAGEPAPSSRSTPALVAAALAGGAVAVALGVYGRVHEPTGGRIVDLGFPSLQAMKAWLATLAFGLAMLQLISALAMFGHLPGVRLTPRWVPFAHRWTGTAAFLVSLPVAYHCLWSLGFEATSARVIVHAVAGCAFYGAFATKLLALRIRRLPGWALPVIGGTLVAALTTLWLTSALWFFTNVDFPAFR
jgi:Family of unknown function (DUF6529)